MTELQEQRLSHLAQILSCTLSPDKLVRSSAEEWLETNSNRENFSTDLLYLIAAENVTDEALKLSASIQLKLHVRKHWEPRHTTFFAMMETDKAIVRENILEIMSNPSLRARVRSQMEESVKDIVREDFPEKWDAGKMMEWILSSMDDGSSDTRKLVGMTAMHAITRKFEFKRETEREEVLNPCVERAFPKMLIMLRGCLERMMQSQQREDIVVEQMVGEYAKAIIKTFWSATYLDIPKEMRQQHAGEGGQPFEALAGWVQTFLQILDCKTPLKMISMQDASKVVECDVTEDELEFKQWPFWKTKKWAQHVMGRLFTRLGNVKLAKEEHKDLAKFFKAYFVESLVNINIKTLADSSLGKNVETRVPDRIVNLALQFLVSAVHVAAAYKAMKPVMPDLITKVCFPLLCYDNSDDELWRDDPKEFVRRSADIMQEMYSPRHAAVNFLSELSRGGKRKTEFFSTVVNCAVEVLQANAQIPDLASRDRSRLDGALYLVGQLSGVLKLEKGYKESLEDMLVAHVLPSFQSPHGNLRAKACWTAAQFADIKFNNPENFVNLFWNVCNCLKDPDLPVKVEAVCSLRAFIDHSEDLETLKPILPQLLDEFFKIMDQVESEDIVYTLETITEKFGEEIAPYALGMTTNLAQAYWKCIKEAEERANAEDDNEGNGNADYDDDFQAMQSSGCLRAISTILTSVSSLPEVYPQLEHILLPIILRMEIDIDLFEEMLEIVGYITYYSPRISQEMWQVWPKMLAVLNNGWALQYFEHVLIPMDNFISRNTDIFVSSAQAKQDTYKICEKVLTPEQVMEEDMMTAPKLMECVLANCKGRVDDLLPLYLQLSVQSLIEFQPDSRFLQDLLMGVVMNGLIYNADQTVKHLQPALPMVLEKLVAMLELRSKSSKKRKHFLRVHDKKIVALGLMALMQSPEANNQNLLNEQSLMHLMKHLVSLLEDLRQQIESEDSRYQDSIKTYLENAAKSRENDVYEQYSRHRDDEDFEEDEDADEMTPQMRYQQALDRVKAGGSAEPLEFDQSKFEEQDFSDSDSEGFAEDDEGSQSPLDDIDAFITFGSFMQALQSTAPQMSQLVRAQSASEVANLTMHAMKRTSEHSKEREEARKNLPPGHNFGAL